MSVETAAAVAFRDKTILALRKSLGLPADIAAAMADQICPWICAKEPGLVVPALDFNKTFAQAIRKEFTGSNGHELMDRHHICIDRLVELLGRRL